MAAAIPAIPLPAPLPGAKRDKRIGAYWSQKSAALAAAVFVDFSENKCANSCLRSNSSMFEIQFFIGRRPMRSHFSWGTRHYCPMEVGAYAIIL